MLPLVDARYLMYVPALNARSSSPSVYRAPPPRTNTEPDASAKESTQRWPKKKLSRLFGKSHESDSASRGPPSCKSSKARWTRMRRKASRCLDRIFGAKAISKEMNSASSSPSMDGTADNASVASTTGRASPKHRTATPRSSAFYKGRRLGRKSPSASQTSVGSLVPRRQVSVRFLDVDGHQLDGLQLDGPISPGIHATRGGGSQESEGSRYSQKMVERMETLAAKLNGASAMDTVVHRSKARTKPSTPVINTNVEAFPEFHQSNDVFSLGSSSGTSGRDVNSFWSPMSTRSTAATSFASPSSFASRYAHLTPEDVHHSSKGFGNGEENLLPPIEEDTSRFLLIPVQDTMIEGIAPSIVTVENAAAAKCALELHFNNLLMSGSSPRSIRRKGYEQRMRDLSMPHDERQSTRQLVVKSESDHLRQMRVLKSTSLARRETKGISIAGFDMIRVLGRGSFGVVRLVTERSKPESQESRYNATGMSVSKDNSTTNVANLDGRAKRNLPSGKPISDMFAMKVIRKSEMLRSCQEGHLRAERDFLVAAEGSTWVVPLLASFQDNTNLYLVMEYMIGGDFLGMLLREDVLDEGVAR